MSSQAILTSHKDDLLVMRISRPDKKNALSSEMYEALSAGIEEANNDPYIGAIVLLGVPGIFCAGNDINDFINFAKKGTMGKPILRFLNALVDNNKPLIAGVDGAAIGIGTTLLLHCDYVLASDRSIFATPFVDLGLIPEAGSSMLIPELVGPRIAFEMLIMARRFDAPRAASLGLINRVTTPQVLEEETLKEANDIASRSREAVSIARALMRPDTFLLRARIEEEAKLFSQRLKSPETRAALEAFIKMVK